MPSGHCGNVNLPATQTLLTQQCASLRLSPFRVFTTQFYILMTGWCRFAKSCFLLCSGQFLESLERSHAWNSPCLWFVLLLLYKLDIFKIYLISAVGLFWDLPTLLQNCCSVTVLPTNQTIAPANTAVIKPGSTVEYPNNCGKGSRATVQYSYTTKVDQKNRSKILTTIKKHNSAHCICVQGEIFLWSQMHLKEWSINNNNL